MKKFIGLLLSAAVLFIGGVNDAYAQNANVRGPGSSKPHKPSKPKPQKPGNSSGPVANYKPLTQYFIVEVMDYGVTFRNTADLTRMLKSIGFSAKGSGRFLRNGTSIQFKGNGYDSYCIIKFRNQAELDDFIDSLYRSHWELWGHIFEHPDNDMGKVYAKVNGLTVTLICPFEMLPNNF